jgi:Icc-related predicted phosphoesterase
VTVSGIEEPVFLDASSGTMEDELQDLSNAMGNAELEGYPFIFVSHAPPRDTALDFTGSGLHVGSLAVRRFLEKWSADGRVLASFHGHIHESPWETGKVWEKIGDIPCFNVGQKSHHLRALLLDTLNPAESARLVVVEPSGEITINEKGVWF